ncbi:hypothetical protein E1286_02315 [Nonomuraea terrae]|uniref:Uncharacterized protein n=1 Tax=Nonomuraea terrae TaxID=2530383 RepID=A0A4R4ZET8_9ACTN|nr:hypothetical protein [Nonomuraea terrae]TDD56480.1 hypothetical protein E1286_02315 [Nonomuraea terrae]
MPPRLLVTQLPTRTMRTAYCLIAEDALGLCVSFLEERSSMGHDSGADVRLFVEALKGGRDSLGVREPLRVSVRSQRMVRDVVSQGRHMEEYNEAAQHLAMEVAIPLTAAFRVVRAIGMATAERGSDVGRSRYPAPKVPLAIAQEDTLAPPVKVVSMTTAVLPPPAMEMPPGTDPRRHLAQELARAHRRAGKPRYRVLQEQLHPLPASPATLSGVFKGQRAPKWELLDPLLRLFGARQDDVDLLWRQLWLAAQEYDRPIGALPSEPAPRPAGYECPDCGSWVIDTDKHLKWHRAMTRASQRGRGVLWQVEGQGA